MDTITTFVFGAKEWLTAIVALVGAVAVIAGWVVRPIKKQAALDRLQMEKIDALTKSVDDLRKQFNQHQVEYVHDRLQTLHEKYCNELGWVSASEKRRVIEWYEAYCARGHNHLAQSYAEDIIKLPEKPTTGE